MNIRVLQHDTTIPYKKVDYHGIEYTVCKDFGHISRYRKLRQVIHFLENDKRFISLETQNYYDFKDLDVEYYIVPTDRENRLDLISNDFYGTPEFGWVLAYINGLNDAFTVYEGRMLIVPKNLNNLYGSNEILGSIPATSLNLGTE